MSSATGDLRAQADFVINSAWRLLAMQDSNPLSPSCGCFHYAYWRDKTSEFPDARFQEAGATLGLLSLAQFDTARAAGRLASSQQLYEGFQSALQQWACQQHPEGSFDEWYKGERGFAATEFTVIAFCLAARFLDDRLLPKDREAMCRVVAKAGRWLSSRHDRVKANHESAAAAALALAWELTGDDLFRRSAKEKLEDTLVRQHPEGWFPEIGGMDLGYCSVLLDYVMIYTTVTRDETAVPAMRRLFDFMLPLIHPDGTISAEMGLCLNPYVSRLGLGLLSDHHEPASHLIAHFQKHSLSIEALRPYLADDLRFCRWSHLPIAAALLSDRFRGVAHAEPFAKSLPAGWTWAKAAGVCAYHGDGVHVYFSPAGGGVVRAFHNDRLVFEDLVPFLRTSEGTFCVAGYDPARATTASGSGFQVQCRFGTVRFFFPGFLARLILRVGSMTAAGSRLLRATIDYTRIKRRSASNQSAAPVANTDSPYRLERHVEIYGSQLRIIDRLRSDGAKIDPGTVVSTVIVNGEKTGFNAPAGSVGNMILTKSLDLAAADKAGLQWHLDIG